MADTSKQFTFTMAPGQFNLGSDAFPLPLGPSKVERILVSFPPGCANLVNCQILCGGTALYPQDSGTFFHFDGYQYAINVTSGHLNGDWAIGIANSDSLQHEIQVNIEYTFLTGNELTAEQLPATL